MLRRACSGAPTAGVLGQGYDPELAQASLQDFLTEKNLTLDEFNQAYDVIVGCPNRPFPTNLTDIIRQMWQEVLQVEVMTQTLAWRDYWPLLDQHHPVEEVFHLHHLGWCADYPDENNFVHEVFNAIQGLNSLRRNCADPNCQTSPSQTEFDQLTLLAGQIADSVQRETLYAQAEQILAGDEAAYIPLYHYLNRALTKPWLERTYSVLGYPAFDTWRVDVEARKVALGQ